MYRRKIIYNAMRIMKFKDFVMESIDIPVDFLEFREYLKGNGVPVDEYGKGTYKTIAHLYKEVKDGETILSEEDGGLVRRVEFVGAKVIYKAPEGTLRLYEAKQVFKDGRTRVRQEMPYSLAEKFKTGEDPKEVLIRGIEEELGINIDYSQSVFYNKSEVINNDDYPGIKSIHIGHEYIVSLNREQYNPDGYIERQDDKDVYFEWRPIKLRKQNNKI